MLWNDDLKQRLIKVRQSDLGLAQGGLVQALQVGN